MKTVLIKDTYHLLQVSFSQPAAPNPRHIWTLFSPVFIPVFKFSKLANTFTSHSLTSHVVTAVPVQTPEAAQHTIPIPRCQSRQSKCSSPFDDLLNWPRGQIPEKGPKLSSCSHTAVSILLCSPEIDCSRDILTFALNQACSGKGSLIRHPFKTAPTSYLCDVWILALYSSHYNNAWWSSMHSFGLFTNMRESFKTHLE